MNEAEARAEPIAPSLSVGCGQGEATPDDTSQATTRPQDMSQKSKNSDKSS